MATRGSPAAIDMYERIFIKGSEDRAMATALLKKYGVVEGIKLAAEALEKDRPADAALLRDLLPAFETWTPELLEKLRVQGLDALKTGLDLVFIHRSGDWVIEHLGHGILLVQAPRMNLCQKTELSGDSTLTDG